MSMNRFTALLVVLSTCAALSSCGATPANCKIPRGAGLAPGEVTGPLMRPGSNCLRCHTAGGLAATKPFSFGGTIFPAPDSGLCQGVTGVRVNVTDAQGVSVTVVSNEAGNFWSTAALTPPFRMSAALEGREVRMPIESPTGGCALCHSYPDAVGGAQGRIVAP